MIMLPDPLFEIGQCVQHRRYGYRGVIVSLALACRAEDGWYQSNQTQPDREQPWYHVLVHMATHTTYAAQENLEADPTPRPVSHPCVEIFFDGFSGGRHVRNDNPWPEI